MYCYRYGFQGQEKDDEVKGEGNSYTTEFRQYDSRIGRWLSLDPLMAKFPNQSPYVAYDNNPIVFKDPRGLAAEIGGPGGRKINQNIGLGVGDASMAGQTGKMLGKATFVFADVREDGGIAVNKPFSNAYRIAMNADVSLEDLYAWNPGLEENKGSIGQGQLIFTSNPLDVPIGGLKEVHEFFKDKLLSLESEEKQKSKDGKSTFERFIEWLRSPDDIISEGGGGSSHGQSYSGNGELQYIDDDVERSANYGPHWLSPMTYGENISTNGDTLERKYEIYKYHWGTFEMKRYTIIILKSTGDTIEISKKELIEYQEVKNGTITSF